MSYRSGLLASVVALSACAQAGVSLEQHTDASMHGADAPASNTDAPASFDAACGPVVTELLTNEAFDGSPLATGWTEARIDPTFDLVTPTGAAGVAPMTTPNMVWLGGFEKPAATNKDSLTQTIAVPAGTTALTLTGNYWVQTAETAPGVYDHGYADLAQSSGTVIENVVSLDDDHATTTWTPFTKTFSAPHAGENVLIKLSSAGDDTDVTNFYFDSLSLKATHPASGCP